MPKACATNAIIPEAETHKKQLIVHTQTKTSTQKACVRNVTSLYTIVIRDKGKSTEYLWPN